jgi:hypothetical protein
MKYTLEFNEKQQMFHFNDGSSKANTYGWFTLLDNVTSIEAYTFEAFAKRIPQDGGVLTKDYLMNQVKEYKRFKDNLKTLGVVC